MDEKTSELRDLFVSVTDAESVTESQAETPGTLVSDRDPEEAVAEVVAEMREALDFETSLPTDALVAVVRGYYAGDDDAAIAATIDADPAAVREARFDLHLVREADGAVDADAAALRAAIDEGADDDALAERFDLPAATVQRVRRTVETRRAIRRVNRRYRDQFESVLRDREIAERMTEDPGSDALSGATEGQEVDVDF